MLAGSPHCGEAANCALHFIARLKMPLSATVKASFWTRHSQRSSRLKKKAAELSSEKKHPPHPRLPPYCFDEREKRRQENLRVARSHRVWGHAPSCQSALSLPGLSRYWRTSHLIRRWQSVMSPWRLIFLMNGESCLRSVPIILGDSALWLRG